MAQNQGFFQPQPGQQTQYSPVFQQQPQNIYQQLGKPQPQRTHSFDQQQQQQLVPQGFQFAPQQQQQYQAPYALTPTPYALSQTPYQPPTTPLSVAPQTFAPAQPQYQQSYQQQYVQQPLVPYSVQQQPQLQPVYQQQLQQQVPVQPQMQLQPQPQQYVQQQPIYQPPPPQQQQQQQQQLPTSLFPNQSTSWRPTSSTSSKPPPISPSASLAKQARAPVAIMPPSAPAPVLSRAPTNVRPQVSPAPPAAPAPASVPARAPAHVSAQPQTPGRRPLPQPVPGANAQPPTLPAGSALHRPPVLPSLNTNTGSSGPFTSSSSSSLSSQQIQRITSPPSSASPTRSSRPLPTPTTTTSSGARRSTVDMGRLPHGASAMVPSIGPISSNNSNSASVSNVAANWPPQNPNRTPSPTKPAEGIGMPVSSRTAGYALGEGGPSTHGSSSPTKRRASPPRFHAGSASQSSSTSVSGSSSPVKENASNSHTTTQAPSYMTRSTGVSNTTPGILPSSSTSTSAHDTHNNTDATPKKFTPMWRRTIPEMPAPAWGYAAGMVAEPHPKPKPPVQAAPPAPAPVPAPVIAFVEKEKGKGKLAKLLKRKKSAPAMAPPAVAAAPVAPPGAAASSGPKTLNSQYPPAQVHGQYQQRQQQSQQHSQQHPQLQQQHQQQRYANWQPQVKTQAQQYAMQHGHQRVPAGYAPRTGMPPQQGQEEEETEEDDDEEEEETGEEQTGEEEETEEEETAESEVEQRPVAHARQYSHHSQASQHQYQQQHPQALQTPQKQRQGSRSQYDEEYEEEYEDEENTPRKRAATPKKGVLRPKMSPNMTYASYNDASPRRIAEKRAAIEREIEREREREAAPKLRLRAKVSGTKSRVLEEAEAEERVLMSGGRRRGVVSQVPLAGDGPSRRTGAGRGHERSRSAFDEREAVRHRREPSEVRHVRRPGSAILAGERRTRRSYDDYDDDECATLAYDDSEEEEEEEEEVQYKKIPKRGAPIRDTRERDWDHRETIQHRRHESSPQYGKCTSAPPMNRRSKSGSGADGRYQDEYEGEDEEVEYRASPGQAASTPKAERRHREEEVEDYGRRPSGLPHPPSLVRGASEEAGQRMSATRMGRVKSVPLKQNDSDGEDHYTRRHSPQDKPELTRQFAKMQLRNANGGPGGKGAPNTTNVWPSGLPRLPRTPGSVATPDTGPSGSGGYFDVRPPSNPAPASSSNFRANETPKQIHTPNRANLNLDDPPPRATVVRTPSPGPRGGYIFKRELPQPQGPPQVHTSSQNYPVTADKVSQQMARRRSLYTASSQPTYQQQQAPTQRPQSQIYSNNGPPPQVQQLVNQLGHPPFNNTRVQQTPAPPQPIGIESPHPVGGREKMADIPKMEEDSNHGSDNERPMIPRISFDSPQQRSPRNPPSIPMINVHSSPNVQAPVINVEPPSIQIESDPSPRKQHFDQGPKIQVYEVPGISVSGPQFDDHHGGPVISISDPDDHRGNQSQSRQHHPASHPQMGQNSGPRTGGLVCGGCHGPIIGRIVSAMGQRYHPACFKCTVCNELLEHVSSYEHDGRPYCHLDYHEAFAPRCFSCKTAIVEEQFISLDDPALGKRAYHAQHFFCAECGDPFLSPSAFPTDSRGEFALSGDGEFEGFTVYKGHPYCEACHVRLRLPKCKRCKKSIRDNDEAVEALGGKWCWGCFVCASCQNPFQDPSFFQRDNQPYCEHCFSVMLRNEV